MPMKERTEKTKGEKEMTITQMKNRCRQRKSGAAVPSNTSEPGGMRDGKTRHRLAHRRINHAGPAARDVRDVAGADQARLGG
jgi:hypothetical protein